MRVSPAAATAGATVEVFGSVASGLDIPSSDIDFALLADLQRPAAGRLLRALTRHLSARGLPARLIPARVPVVQVSAGGAECDVSVQDALCLHKAALLRAYGRADARFRGLFRLTKHWARRRGLNDAFRGTLNSFAYALLTVQFLQTRRPPILPCLQAPRVEHAGRAHELPPPAAVVRGLEVRFIDGAALDNYGATNPAPAAALFPPLLAFIRDLLDRRADWAVSVRAGAPLPRRPDGGGGAAAAAGLVRIEDPFDPADNVARSLSAPGAARLRAELERACGILRDAGDLHAVCAPA